MLLQVLFTIILGALSTVAGYNAVVLPQMIDEIDSDIDRISELSSLNQGKIN